MKNIKADVAFLPAGGTYTMDYKEAIGVANTIKPIAAVPIHYADVAGSTDDAQAFTRGLNKGITGVVLRDLLKGVTHMKQSTIRIQGGKVLYFDPIGIEGEPKDADIIFISHSHGDHFTPSDIKKLMKDDTVLVLPKDCVETAVKEGITNIVCVSPSKSYEIDGQKFTTNYSYNTNKDFHKKGINNISYTVNVNNTTYYFAGDTDIIPEMKDIKANVAFLPVGGTYTMDSKEAATAANTINPLVAVPIHFADVVGTMDDAKHFVAKLNSSIKGVILKK
jgi:L-ascorbate metabolism protein UlaG (beta-lactamase superfamily)